MLCTLTGCVGSCRIGTGTIEIAPDIAEIEPNHVRFTDGRRVRCDALIFATGYHISFPFLKPELQPTRKNRVGSHKEEKVDPTDPLGGNGVDAYKAVFAPHLPVTLAHIGKARRALCCILALASPAPLPCAALVGSGLFQPLGAIMPISEMQARWVCGIWKGKYGLPSAEEMQKDCDQFAQALSERYLARPRHTIQVRSDTPQLSLSLSSPRFLVAPL